MILLVLGVLALIIAAMLGRAQRELRAAAEQFNEIERNLDEVRRCAAKVSEEIEQLAETLGKPPAANDNRRRTG